MTLLEQSGERKPLGWYIDAEAIFQTECIELVNEVLNQEYYCNDRRFIMGYITLMSYNDDDERVLEPFFIIKLMKKVFNALESDTKRELLKSTSAFYDKDDHYIILKKRVVL